MRTMTPRMIATLSLFLIVFAALNFFIGWNATELLRVWVPDLPQAVFWVPFVIVSFGYILGRIPFRPRPVARGLKVIGAYYIGLFEYAVLLLPFADLAAWLLHLGGMDHHRIVQLLGIIVTLLLLGLFLWGTRNAWSPIVRKYELQVDKQAGDLKQMNVVVVSDLHLGNIVGNRHLNRLIPRVAALKPDLILLAGDVIDDVIEPFVRNKMSENLKRLQARWGTYAVLGNHEYYGGHVEEYIGRMKDIGIPVLRDEHVTIADRFHVVGRKDKTAETADQDGRKPLQELLAELDPSLPILVMDHQPYAYDKAAAAGADVLVSGHTHRGQFAPNHLITRRLFELDWGYLRKGKMHAVVSSGYGTWGPPVRLASRSEIIHLVIRFV